MVCPCTCHHACNIVIMCNTWFHYFAWYNVQGDGTIDIHYHDSWSTVMIIIVQLSSGTDDFCSIEDWEAVFYANIKDKR